jgi:hypothetical protein
MIDKPRRQFITAGAVAVLVAATESARPGEENAGVQDRVIERARALLGSLQAQALAPFLADWPVTKERRAIVPSTVPVLRWLAQVEPAAPAFSRELVRSLQQAAPFMAWRQTYTASQVGAAFLENYGWTEIIGLSGALASERLACGFLLLGPSIQYPRHRHEAEEIYIPLVGTASWQQGDGLWREHAPGTVIHHASNEPHAMTTGADPLLALYLWRSANLNQKAQLVR